MNREIVVPLAALGLCEGCEVLINMAGFPTDVMDATWICSGCNTGLR